MSFNLVDEEKTQLHRIKVVGVGGAGNNAINNMIEAGLTGVSFIAANTDRQALDVNKASVKIQLGERLTEGLGAGANPEVGRQAAEESKDVIKAALAESHMVFITAGLGGGTGTGAAPVIAEICKEIGALTVGVVTKPFVFEAKKRSKQAEEGLARLNEMADTVITIPNDRLRGLDSKKATILEMFKRADEVLLHSVQGVTDLIMKPGLVNLDFADVRTTMSKAGMALMGIGRATGENRAAEAASKALNHPLLEDISISGAGGVLMNITAGPDLTLEEVLEASDLIHKEAGDDAEIIWGTALDENLGEELHVTLIATGIGNGPGQPQGRGGRGFGGRVRDLTPEDMQRAVNLDEPTFIRKKKAVGEGSTGAVYRGLILDGDDLDVPTFMRRKAD